VGRSNLKFNTSKQDSKRMVRPKPCWNDAVCVQTKDYSLTVDELQRRKSLFVSKNNVLHSKPKHAHAHTQYRKKMSNNTRTYTIVKNKIVSETPTADESDGDMDDTVLDLLHTPTKSASDRPPLSSSTPNTADKTYDLMDGDTQLMQMNSSTIKKDDADMTNMSIEENDSVWVSVVDEQRHVDKVKVLQQKTKTRHNNKTYVVPKTTSAFGRSIKQPNNHQSKVENRMNTTNSSIKNAPSIVESLDKRINDNFSLEEDKELEVLAEEISSLASELQYYEQLTGRRSALELDTAELAAITAPLAGQSRRSMLSVMRVLTRLVCQTMTYLLKSEVEQQSARNREDTLLSRVDALTALVMPHSVDIMSDLQPTSSTLLKSEQLKKVDAYAQQLPPTPPVQQQNIFKKNALSTRVNGIVLDNHVANIRATSFNKDVYDAQRYTSITSEDYTMYNSGENTNGQGQASLNISLSEGSVQAVTAPFSAQVSPVRGKRNMINNYHMPLNKMPVSTTDLLFSNNDNDNENENELMSDSLVNSIGPSLYKATTSAEQVQLLLSTPQRNQKNTNVEHKDQDLSNGSANCAYKEYLASQQRIELFESTDDSIKSTEDDFDNDYDMNDSEDEIFDSENIPLQFEDEDENENENENEGADEDDVWNSRMGAVDALVNGVANLSHAVNAVRDSPVQFTRGPFSSMTRFDDNKENITPNANTKIQNDEAHSIVVPQISCPKPTQTPQHPFASKKSSKVESEDVAMKHEHHGIFGHGGRLRERTFKF
jgi:hypothetical protein